MTQAPFDINATSTLFGNADQLRQLLQSVTTFNSLTLNENRDIIPASLISSIWPEQHANKRLVEFQFMLILARGKHLLNSAEDIHLIKNIAAKLGLVKGSSRSLHEHAELNDIVLKVFNEMTQQPRHTQAEFIATLGKFYRRHKEELSPYARYINNSIAVIGAKLLDCETTQANATQVQQVPVVESSKEESLPVEVKAAELENPSFLVSQTIEETPQTADSPNVLAAEVIAVAPAFSARILCNKLRVEVDMNSDKVTWDINHCYSKLTNKAAFTKNKDSKVEHWIYQTFLAASKGFDQNDKVAHGLFNVDTLIKNLGFNNAFSLLCRGYQLAYELSSSGSSNERLQAKHAVAALQTSLETLVAKYSEDALLHDTEKLPFNKKYVSGDFIVELYNPEINNSKINLIKSLFVGVLLFGVYHFQPKPYVGSTNSTCLLPKIPLTLLKGRFDLYGTSTWYR